MSTATGRLDKTRQQQHKTDSGHHGDLEDLGKGSEVYLAPCILICMCVHIYMRLCMRLCMCVNIFVRLCESLSVSIKCHSKKCPRSVPPLRAGAGFDTREQIDMLSRQG